MNFVHLALILTPMLTVAQYLLQDRLPFCSIVLGLRERAQSRASRCMRQAHT